MSATWIHTSFDALAWIAAALSLYWLTKRARVQFPPSPAGDWHYIAVLVCGAGLGAVVLGTANLWLSHQTGFGRSIEGAIAGGILAVELYKRRAHITSRTGARFALPLAIGAAVGRIGCYLSGLSDFTYGTPTGLPWGHDFGDGIARHPVQIYESAAMTVFALVYVWRALNNDRMMIENGFYLAVGYYGLQRFMWEFIKPYGTVFGPFTLFHLLSVMLVLYAAIMIATAQAPGAVDDRAFA